jgi:hypothetical protein
MENGGRFLGTEWMKVESAVKLCFMRHSSVAWGLPTGSCGH